MTRHQSEEILNDYVDEVLSDDTRREVKRHLDECVDCRAEVENLRSLLRRAASLPDVPPSRDLLPAIRRATTSRGAVRQRWVALAASLLIVVTAGIGTLVVKRGSQPVVALRPSESATIAPEETALADLHEAEAAFVRATQVLLATLEARRKELPAETVATLERNLALLDATIDEVRLALDAGQGEAQDAQILTALYQKRMQLLWRVSRLSS